MNAYLFQGIHSPFFTVFRAEPLVFGAEHDIFQDFRLKQLVLRILEYQSYMGPKRSQIVTGLPDILVFKQNLARGGTDQAVQMLNQR
jgi:hypothetical protein